MNIGAGFEDGDCLVGVAGFNHLEARISDHFRRADPEQQLIFHDENTTGRLTAKAIQNTFLRPSLSAREVHRSAAESEPHRTGSEPEIRTIASASCYVSGPPEPQPRSTERIHARSI
jgi:hypothetical protein